MRRPRPGPTPCAICCSTRCCPAVAFEHSLIGLHASAVVVSGRGVAFAGPTSRGKSTLAASFALDGHAVVTDDCLMLRWTRAEPCAVPSYPSLRLWRSTAESLLGANADLPPVAQYTSKLRIGARVPGISFRRQPVRVGKIYVIDRRAGPARIDLLSRREAYVELLKTTFHLDPLDRVTARREVAALAAIVRRVPVARLRVPLRLESLGQVRRAIAADLAGDGPIFVIQLTRSGLCVSSPDEVNRLAGVFARQHSVLLRGFLEPALCDAVARIVAAARFTERVHGHLDPPAIDLGLDDPAAHGRLLVLFNDARLFRFVEAVTGCGAIGSFQGTVYRIIPGVHGLDSWHDDLHGSRIAALTVNLSPAWLFGRRPSDQKDRPAGDRL